MKNSLFALLLGLGLAGSTSVGDAAATELVLQNAWTNAPFETSNAEAFLDDGIVHFKGAIQFGSDPVLFTLPTALRPATTVYVAVDLCNAITGRLIIQPDGVVSVQSTTTFAAAQCFTSLDGAKFALSADGFTPLTLDNGWTVSPFGTSSPAAALIDGIVHLQGAIAGGTTALPFVLPPGFRPDTDVYAPVNLCAGAKGRLWIQSSGVVTIESSTSFGDAQCFTSLDGVSFAPSAAGFTVLTLANDWIGSPFSTSAPAASVVDGIVRLKGALANGTSATLFVLPAGLRPATNVFVPIDLCGAAKGRLQIRPTGEVLVESLGSGSTPQCFTSLDGASFVIDPSGFVDLPLGNGWIQSIFVSQTAQAARYDGIVHLRGAIQGGTDPILFTLPVTMRPAADVYVAVDLCNARVGRLWITPSGQATVQSVDGFGEAECFTSLEGVTFAPSATGFTPLTLENGWVGSAYGTSSPAVARINGIVHLKGGITSGTSDVTFTLPLGMRPATNVMVQTNLCGGAKGRLLILPSGVVIATEPAGFSPLVQCFTSLDGVKFAPSTAGFAPLTPVNGWTNTGFGTNAPAAALLRDVVYLEGAISSGSTAEVFTLPPPLRPTGNVYVPIDLCNATKGRLIIDAAGLVTVQPLGPFSDAQCFTSLDGASYAVPEPWGLSTLAAGVILLAGLGSARARRQAASADAD